MKEMLLPTVGLDTRLEECKGREVKLKPISADDTWVRVSIGSVSFLGDHIILVPETPGYVQDDGPREIRYIMYDRSGYSSTVCPKGRKTRVELELLSTSCDQDC